MHGRPHFLSDETSDGDRECLWCHRRTERPGIERPVVWADVEALALVDPYIYALLSSIRSGEPREQALIDVTFRLARVRASMQETLTQYVEGALPGPIYIQCDDPAHRKVMVHETETTQWPQRPPL